MDMNTTSLHIKIEPDIKREAQKTADELGLSLSAVTKALLKQFIRTKQLSVSTRDLPEIPDNVKKGLEVVPVATVDEVLARALVKPLVAIEWPNDLEAVPAKPVESTEVRAH